MSKVAIVIVSFNKSHLTNLCLHSIFVSKVRNPFKVIIVDNNSTQRERDKLVEFIKFLGFKYPKQSIDLILSSENLGFSGGNNLGISKALLDSDVKYLCLLNNDTIVSDYWLDRLVQVAKIRKLVGPVTNSVANEQVVAADYTPVGCNNYTVQMVNEFAQKWHKDHEGQVVSSEMLGFFCVLGHRDIFEKVGLLDENFGIGTFEDDDFCFRCIKAGIDLLIARDTYIHHWGSASFSEIQNLRMYKLTQTNRAYFEMKHKLIWNCPVDTLPLAIKHEFDWLLKTGNQEIWKYIDSYIKRQRSQVLGLYYAIESSSTPILFWKDVFKRLGINFLAKLRSSVSVKKYNAIKLLFYALTPFFYKSRAEVSLKLRLGIRELKKILKTKLSKREIKNKKIVLYLPCSLFEGRFQRSQHLAVDLAKNGKTILWLEPEADTHVQSYFGGLSTEKIQDGLSLYRLRSSCVDYTNFYVSGLTLTEADNVLASLRRMIGDAYGGMTVIVNQPFWGKVLQSLNKDPYFKGKIVYDCMDDHMGFGSATIETELYEKLLLENADALVVSSQHLYESKKNIFKNHISLIRNAANVDDFLLKDSRKVSKTIGYFGAIAEWFDANLVIQAAQSMPDYTFELIGNYDHSLFSRMSSFPLNLKLRGEVPYSQLKDYAQNWEAALIPFLITPLIQATNPVKLYEYCAMGLPVISTPIPEVMVADVEVSIVNNAIELEAAIRSVDNSVSAQEKRVSFALQNTWRHRASSFLQVITND